MITPVLAHDRSSRRCSRAESQIVSILKEGEAGVAARSRDRASRGGLRRLGLFPYTRVSRLDDQSWAFRSPPENTNAVINATNLSCSITCKDLEASIRFYREAIGFPVAQTYQNEGKVAAAVVAAGDCRIVLNQDDGTLGWDRVKGQGFYLQINVAGAADVDRAAARIAAAGGTLLDEPADRPWGVRMFQFKDLDGFKLGVSTPLVG
jgi:lactoylglutathione lyase